MLLLLFEVATGCPPTAQGKRVPVELEQLTKLHTLAASRPVQ